MDFLLVADIGGTSCRLATFAKGASHRLKMVARQSVPTNQVHTTQDLVSAFRSAFGEEVLAHSLALSAAVAGPVAAGEVTLSNADLCLRETEARELLQGIPVCLLNDFAAVSLAVTTESGKKASLVYGRPQSGCEMLVKACVGAGTGFGCAILVPREKGTWSVLPSEGGHMAFPFVDRQEQEFHEFVKARRHIAWADTDEIVSGRGLEALHAFCFGRELAAGEIGQEYLAVEKNSLLKTLFARFYARACRHWILSTLCRGGLWLAGGIMAKNPGLVRIPAFRDELVQGVYGTLVAEIPLYVFCDEDSGLWGAARAAESAAQAARPVYRRK